MIIRRANSRDIPVLLGLSRSFSTSPYAFDKKFKALSKEIRPAFAESMIHSPHALTLVAEDRSSITGYITVSLNPAVSGVIGKKVGGILLLAVDENIRNRGIGKRLVQNGLKLLFHSGAELVTVVTDLYNIPAIHVYESFGFRFVLSWHIFRFYPYHGGKLRINKTLNKNIDKVQLSSLDRFCEGFNRPVSLLKERGIDRGSLKNYFIRNLKNSIVKGKSAAYQYFQRGKPAGLINVGSDDIARKTLGPDQKPVLKVMDLIVPPSDEQSEIQKKMLSDIQSRMEDYCLLEYWVDAESAGLIESAEDAGFRLAYTGVAYHLAR